jgi:hypothetical protein
MEPKGSLLCSQEPATVPVLIQMNSVITFIPISMIHIVCGLIVSAVSILDYVALNGRLIFMNWNLCGRKQLWPDLRYYSRVSLGDRKA